MMTNDNGDDSKTVHVKYESDTDGLNSEVIQGNMSNHHIIS